MNKYLAVGLLAYWAGRQHKALSRKFCWDKLRKEVRRMISRV